MRTNADLPQVALAAFLALGAATVTAASAAAAPEAAARPVAGPMAGGSGKVRAADLPVVAPAPVASGQLRAAMARLGVVGSALYVAAHPDDENTRLIAWLVGQRGVRTAYLSLTRGGGGQNLVGKERSDLLGVIRTHELLAARAIDGAEQRFSRAVDFGYSKTPSETLATWGREAVLSDMVAVIRRFKPDVIINRFSATARSHGHHTASAILAAEAFAAAADPKRFPEQVARWGIWQASRLVENKSTWRLPKDADVSMYAQQDVGGYSPALGLSWGQVAAFSRSSHKSQGFGAAPLWGPARELFVPLAGEAAPSGIKSKDPLFEGIDLSWARYPKTGPLRAAIAAAIKGLRPDRPEASVPALARVRRLLTKLPDGHRWKATKLAEVEALMVAAAGLHIDATAKTPAAVAGGPLAVSLLALARRPVAARVSAIRWSTGTSSTAVTALAHHKPKRFEATLTVPSDAPVSTPYWLRVPREAGTGLYRVDDPQHIGLADDPPPLFVSVSLTLAGERLVIRRPLLYRWVDRVRGELVRRVEIRPAVTATPDAEVLMLAGPSARLSVTLRAHADKQKGTCKVVAPPLWRVMPVHHDVELAKAGDEAVVMFEVQPPSAQAAAADLRIETSTAAGLGRLAEYGVRQPHIPETTVFVPARCRAVPLALATGGKRIGYIAGAGDEVAARLGQVGYQVTDLAVADLNKADLSRFDAIVTGVRAFNVHPRLLQIRQRLFDYVARGGTMVVQYNTNGRWRRLTHPLGPAPFVIARGRVTDERAPLNPLAPDHPLLTRPNRLTAADYQGWVQERGLYFAESWDRAYTPIFAVNDPGDPVEQGAVLVTAHGKGGFVYTGLSFFRQLPAGVPGAYRLLANLLAWQGK